MVVEGEMNVSPRNMEFVERVLNSENRTNNHAETANKKLYIEMGVIQRYRLL